MSCKYPFFQFYVSDFLADANVACMTPSAVGCYVRLLCHAWIEGGLPDDDEKLRRLCGAEPGEWRIAWQQVRCCWELDPDGLLRNPRLERERTKAKAKTEAAKGSAAASAKARSERSANAQRTLSVGSASQSQSQSQRSEDVTALDPVSEQRDVQGEANHRPRRGRGTGRAPSGTVQEFLSWFQARWRETRLGTEYEIQTKDGVAVAALVKAHGLEEVKVRADRMLLSPDAWTAQNASPATLRSRWNALAVVVLPRPARRAATDSAFDRVAREMGGHDARSA